MALDVSQFFKLVVADTCAVWNVLSSRLLHRIGIDAGCHFSITEFVLYECLHKPRRQVQDSDLQLQQRLREAQREGQFQTYAIDVEDLQEVELLERRRNLSKGELTAIAFAKKTQQAFLTDDQGARKLAGIAMKGHLVQTTPHLLGWLVFIGRLVGSDIDRIIEEHDSLERPLRRYFSEMYEEAMRCRLMTKPDM